MAPDRTLSRTRPATVTAHLRVAAASLSDPASPARPGCSSGTAPAARWRSRCARRSSSGRTTTDDSAHGMVPPRCERHVVPQVGVRKQYAPPGISTRAASRRRCGTPPAPDWPRLLLRCPRQQACRGNPGRRKWRSGRRVRAGAAGRHHDETPSSRPQTPDCSSSSDRTVSWCPY